MKKHPRLSAIFASLSAASLVLVSSVSFAGHEVVNYKGEVPPCPPKILPGGFYIGVGASYDSYRFRNRFSAVDDEGDSFVFSNPLSARGWDGEANIGYGFYWDQLYTGAYLGLELAGVISNAESSTHITTTDEFGDTDSATFTTRARGSWSASVLPGIKLNESTLLYIRLGYIDTRFRGKVTLTDSPDDGTFTRSRNRWRSGFLGGVGLETYVLPMISLRGEYQYTWYGNYSTNGTFSDVTINARTKPTNSSFTLGLAYHFCL